LNPIHHHLSILLSLLPWGTLFSVSLIIAILIVLSALVSCAETALFFITAADKEMLHNSSNKKDTQLFYLLENSKHLLASLIVANNFFNMSIVILSAYVTGRFINGFSHPYLVFFIQVILVTLVLLFLCDTMPKAYATGHYMKVSRVLLPFAFIIRALFYPFASLLVFSTGFMDKYVLKNKPLLSSANLSEALEITSKEEIPQGYHKILKDIIQLGNKDVKEVMQPRIDIIAFDEKMSFSELFAKAVECGFSRIPIYSSSLDNITGILYTKDLIAHIGKDDTFKWRILLHRAFFVPEGKMINDLLEDFREKKIHLAIVVDEFGSVSGLITLEDIVEEILGEISDEFDEEKLLYSKLDDQNFVFEGKISLGDFCRIIEVDESIFQEKKGGADTVGGLMVELCGRIPEKKEKIKFANLVFLIEAADKRTVQRIKVTIQEPVQKA
jgi:putative hemolysin